MATIWLGPGADPNICPNLWRAAAPQSLQFITGADQVPEIYRARDNFSAFDRRTVANEVRRNILDARSRQVGSE